jgi:hypothetical protein
MPICNRFTNQITILPMAGPFLTAPFNPCNDFTRILARIFEHMTQEELSVYIKSKPTGKYAQIWFFYEFLTVKHLPIDGITSGN